MKLILLMCIEEYTEDLRKLLLDHEVRVFSETNIQGHRIEDKDYTQSWFSGSDAGIYSHLFFSFLEMEKSKELMETIDQYNREHPDPHPMRAFLLDVEEYV